ncbi:hypothetical protein TD95_001233 [Thielaviopsis punctulata]|uniref:Ion transport domain-containing protein n=1 Tax=Thielaviopsis punctulata TaxID=72032 RepID=A0A0F4Z9W7_9PEZI|nr:hypothetical protein TD95_001079 [Thielaviopsis punctulata]KKA27647.1 hypothetical protein TD95_001233 [Thielaviopsis punctulata]
MLSSFLAGTASHPPPASQSVPELSQYPTSAASRLPEPRHATADFSEDDDDHDDSVLEYPALVASGLLGFTTQREPVEDGRRLPVLPLFSASHLDSLPIYSLTHAIRILVQTRTETTLTWDQLRSPQVSQFLVKPMQQAIRSQHFSRATLYALMANTLQFAKEAQLYPGNAGASKTRSNVCELLAIKLLKEYNTRELIDALSYDFHPLQGFTGFQTTAASKKSDSRTSTLEVAIRASAKHFLAHPLVIQQLEAIWSGAISFYSTADTLHRVSTKIDSSPYNTNYHYSGRPDSRTPLLGLNARFGNQYSHHGNYHTSHNTRHPSGASDENLDSYKPGRRTVSLYDPRHASPFKLSRLRVPRYRSFLSTLSLAVLIGLFLAVLVQRSIQITGLELIFWFWSAGFMLDELVGFNEQGFSLYIMSFWNIFDLGILCMLVVYYCMRAYGVFILDPHHWNDMAYDVLAANAILLLPRIFSVLDHYPYFSQLLIAFRLMAVDLAAVMFLVVIACSGFFVYFTFSKNHQDSAGFAYSMFQIIMGFTPAAWDVWEDCNLLGKSLLVLFLIICHFVIVTILITVLTNSFMAIASNATQEHQFLFAINTISMVKNDSLFSYIPPGNIFAWLLMPLRYVMPLRHFVWLNRLVIKITHFPILWAIFVYERYFLAPSIYEPTDLVDHPGVSRGRGISIADPASRIAAFSPNLRVREESVVGFQKDRALEEVFRRPPDPNTLRNQRRTERRRNQTEIRNWIDRSEATRPAWEAGNTTQNDWMRRYSTQGPPHQPSDVRSAASDPAADTVSNNGFKRRHSSVIPMRAHHIEQELRDQTDGGDGDDELPSHDELEDDNVTTSVAQSYQDNLLTNKFVDRADGEDEDDDDNDEHFLTPTTARPNSAWPSSSPRTAQPRQGLHNRAISTSTVMFNPDRYGSREMSTASTTDDGSDILDNSGLKTPTAGQWSPRRMPAASPPARPIALSKSPGIAGPSKPISASESEDDLHHSRRLSSIDATMSASQILPESDMIEALSSSFQTQMAMALKHGRMETLVRSADAGASDRDRMSRLVLARMKTLEESFSEVIREMRELKDLTTAPPTRRNSVVNLALAPAAKIHEGCRKTGRQTPRSGGARSREHSLGSTPKRVPVRRVYKSPRSSSVMGRGAKGKMTATSESDIAELPEEGGSTTQEGLSF